MFRLGQLWRRLGLFAKRDHHLGDLDEEVEAHIALMADENVRKGMSPKEALQKARREFGHVDTLKEEVYDTWGMRFIDNVFRNTRLTIMQMKKRKGFTATVVLTLALGIGANTAIFSLANAVLFQPLSYPESDRLLILDEWSEQFSRFSVSYPNFIDWRERQNSFSSIGLSQYR